MSAVRAIGDAATHRALRTVPFRTDTRSMLAKKSRHSTVRGANRMRLRCTNAITPCAHAGSSVAKRPRRPVSRADAHSVRGVMRCRTRRQRPCPPCLGQRALTPLTGEGRTAVRGRAELNPELNAAEDENAGVLRARQRPPPPQPPGRRHAQCEGKGWGSTRATQTRPSARARARVPHPQQVRKQLRRRADFEAQVQQNLWRYKLEQP